MQRAIHLLLALGNLQNKFKSLSRLGIVLSYHLLSFLLELSNSNLTSYLKNLHWQREAFVAI